LHRGKFKYFLRVGLILSFDSLDSLLSSFLFLLLNVGKRQFEHAMRHWVRFHFTLHGFRLLYELRLGLGQVEWLWLGYLLLTVAVPTVTNVFVFQSALLRVAAFKDSVRRFACADRQRRLDFACRPLFDTPDDLLD
jgi:hypothetical protein